MSSTHILTNEFEYHSFLVVHYQTLIFLFIYLILLLLQTIACYVANFHKNWDIHLQQFAYNFRTMVHDSTGKSPAELHLGRKQIIPF